MSYPIFGICLIIMALGVSGSMLFSGNYVMPELWENFGNMHPNGTPIWSFMFIAIACGAISGFHALVSSGTTAKQLSREKDAKLIGYGSMLVECALAIVSLITICYIFGQKGADAFKIPPDSR